MQQLCTAYVRYSDLEVPFRTQRSMVKVIFHLDRKGLDTTNPSQNWRLGPWFPISADLSKGWSRWSMDEGDLPMDCGFYELNIAKWWLVMK
jgi:hypothetical protein